MRNADIRKIATEPGQAFAKIVSTVAQTTKVTVSPTGKQALKRGVTGSYHMSMHPSGAYDAYIMSSHGALTGHLCHVRRHDS